MEIHRLSEGSTWNWPLLGSVVVLNVCVPSLVLAYGVFLVNSLDLGVPLWLGLSTPAIFIFSYSLTQCWCRDAADSWGGPVGYRVMASLGLLLVVTSLLLCAFLPYHLQPYIYGVLGGCGSSLISAQVDAVVFETYDTRLALVRGICFGAQAVGQSIFPHIITAFMNCYGYPFSFIVLSGVMLQTLPAILFLKIDESIKRPVPLSRYTDKTYAIFNNEVMKGYTNELQLHDLNKKCWKSPQDDNVHREELLDDVQYDNDVNVTITPPPSPEEKRRNIFGVEILPEIPEESEDSDESDADDASTNANKSKKQFSNALKRLSTLGDSFDEYITKQIRRDSQTDRDSESREYTEVEVTYDTVSPVTDIQREKIFNSFSFRCQSAYASFKRRMRMPSYRVYRLKRRLLFMMYSINDTFVKPLSRSLSCWRFYPALLLCFSKLSLTAITLVLLPVIASQVKPKISSTEANFMFSLHGFTWMCILLSTPWLAQTPKRNFKYVTLIGLLISTVACFVLSIATNHDLFSIGCVVGGLGYGALTSCWETAVQDFVGLRKWPKFHSALETLSGTLLFVFWVGLSFVVDQDGGVQYAMFIQSSILAGITLVWVILAAVSLYFTKVRSLRFGRRWKF
ncbi:uncharacterized protein LOC128669343 [Plodia interpunctella]|uniref:uncharacterized protein LOC128669343 n=1 Tax=Plodia interpunctella TaxID=58824 RepID=UPI002368314E|nr:uncharacterized protein LOC128669343 [Plodia interpunctella]